MSIQGSNKPNIDFAKSIYAETNISAYYSVTTAWANATSWAVTIPKTGEYDIECIGSYQLDDNNADGDVDGRLRLYNNTAATPISNTEVKIEIYGTANNRGSSTFYIKHRGVFTAGDVITMQGIKDTVAADTINILGNVGSYLARISCRMTSKYVNVYDTDKVHSLSEINTGRIWIDGKPIYRKVIDFGLLPNTASKNVAHGIVTLDKVINLYGISDNGTYQIPIPHTNTAGLNFSYSTFVDQTNVNITTGGATHTAYYAYITLEYTKV